MKINKTPLFMNMTEPKLIAHETVVEINAINFTHDFDVELGNKTGMHLTWSCVRTNETIFRSIVGNSAPVHQACLGDGKKVSLFVILGSNLIIIII